jgi:predicted nucleic acid-binding Zn ribbon protein
VLPIQHFSAGVLADILRAQPHSPGRTTLAWQLAVGPALARVTTATLADGVLTVHGDDPRWLREIARSRPIVLERLQRLLGPDSITRISI